VGITGKHGRYEVVFDTQSTEPKQGESSRRKGHARTHTHAGDTTAWW